MQQKNPPNRVHRLGQAVLLSIVLGGIGYWAWGKVSSPASPQHTPATGDLDAPAPIVMGSHVRVTYFTTDVRCDACREIEALTVETLERQFGQEMRSGELVFEILNLDRPENRHYGLDYQLAFKTVVVADIRAGEVHSWQSMDEVWKHFTDPAAFQAYLARPIRLLLWGKEIPGS